MLHHARQNLQLLTWRFPTDGSKDLFLKTREKEVESAPTTRKLSACHPVAVVLNPAQQSLT